MLSFPNAFQESSFSQASHRGCEGRVSSGERTISICNMGRHKLERDSIASRRKSERWKLMRQSPSRDATTGSCLSVSFVKRVGSLRGLRTRHHNRRSRPHENYSTLWPLDLEPRQIRKNCDDSVTDAVRSHNNLAVPVSTPVAMMRATILGL